MKIHMNSTIQHPRAKRLRRGSWFQVSQLFVLERIFASLAVYCWLLAVGDNVHSPLVTARQRFLHIADALAFRGRSLVLRKPQRILAFLVLNPTRSPAPHAAAAFMLQQLISY